MTDAPMTPETMRLSLETAEVRQHSRAVVVRSAAASSSGTTEVAIVSERFVTVGDRAEEKNYPAGGSGPAVELSRTRFDRREWDEVKAAIDRAFDEYESRWPTTVILREGSPGSGRFG